MMVHICLDDQIPAKADSSMLPHPLLSQIGTDRLVDVSKIGFAKSKAPAVGLCSKFIFSPDVSRILNKIFYSYFVGARQGLIAPLRRTLQSPLSVAYYSVFPCKKFAGNHNLNIFLYYIILY